MSTIASTFNPHTLNYTGLITNATGSVAVLTTSNGLFISTNYGVSWPQSTGLHIGEYSSVTGDMSLNNIFVIVDSQPLKSIYTSTDKGVSWTSLTPSLSMPFNIVGISAPTSVKSNNDASRLYATDNSHLLVSTNLGSSWTVTYTASGNPPFQQPSIITNGNGQYLYYTTISGGSNSLFYSSNYGTAFTLLATGLANTQSIVGATNSTGNSIAYRGTTDVYISSNNGASYNTISGITAISISYDLNNNIIFASATNVYKTADYGLTYTSYSVTGISISRVANDSTGSNIYITDSNTGIYYTNNSGTGWALFNSFTSNNLTFNKICSNASGSKLYATVGLYNNFDSYGSIYYSANYGQSWVNANVSSNTYNSISTDSSGQNVYSSYYSQAPLGFTSSSALIKSTNYGISWNNAITPTGGRLVYYVSNSYNGRYVYSIGSNTPMGFSTKPTEIDFIYSNDYGASFTTVTNIAFAWTPKYVICNKSSNPSIDGQYVTICTGNNTNAPPQSQIAAQMHISSDYGATFSNANAFNTLLSSSAGYSVYSLACNSDSSVIIATIQTTFPLICISTNYGSTITQYAASSISPGYAGSPYGGAPMSCITCDSTGQQISLGLMSDSMCMSTNQGSTWTVSSTGSFWSGYNTQNVVGSNYKSVIWSCITSNYDGSRTSAGMLYGGIYTTSSGGATWYNYMLPVPPVVVVCFLEDSKILCFKDGVETYIPIQNIRPGDLVKTLKDGYVAVNMLGYRKIEHTYSEDRDKNSLYLCSNDKYPEVFEDLVITGCHSILVDELTEAERVRTREVNGDLYVTDAKYRLPACADERASVYTKEGEFTIYHLALDNDDYYMNYGIYANGLLVETCSKRYLRELSNMALM